MSARACCAGGTQIAVAVTIKDARPPLPDDPSVLPPRLRKLIASCWESDPLVRPCAAEVVKQLVLARRELQAAPGPRPADAFI